MGKTKLQMIKEIYQVIKAENNILLQQGIKHSIPTEEVYTKRMMKNDDSYVTDLYLYYVVGDKNL